MENKMPVQCYMYISKYCSYQLQVANLKDKGNNVWESNQSSGDIFIVFQDKNQ